MSHISTVPVFINDISFETPALDFQARLTAHYEMMAAQAVGPDAVRYGQLVRFMRSSGVQHRYSVFGTSNSDASFNDFIAFQGNEETVGTTGSHVSTGSRMELFKKLAPRLAFQTIEKLRATNAMDKISHVIVVSCTGAYSPFLDADIATHFGLAENVRRLIIGSMGCHGAFNALRAAFDTVRAEPNSRVLVVAIELCSLHRQNSFAQKTSEDFQSKAVTNSLFGDACGAAIVSARETGLKMLGFGSHSFPKHHDLLTWDIGDRGFEMGLKKELAKIIPSLFKESNGLSSLVNGIDEWALHAGGPKVIGGIGEGLGLSPAQLERSYEVLRSVGNTSSTSILRNLQSVLEMSPAGKRICAIGLGPGIQVETARFLIC